MKWLKRYVGDNFWEAKFFQPQYNFTYLYNFTYPSQLVPCNSLHLILEEMFSSIKFFL